MNKKLLYLVILSLCIFIMPVKAQQGGNPASDYCVKQGGSLEIKKDADGAERGICKFPNGQTCDEWAFFREECKPENKAGMPNPAAVYCVKHGGNYQITKDSQGDESGICKFPDGKVCDEWKFFRGECKPENKANVKNPNSAYCMELGGKLIYRTDSKRNKYGVCIFKNKKECEDWQLFQGKCKPDNGASIANMPNPASVNCIKKGGRLIIKKDKQGNEYGVCKFKNKKECEEWKFFRGECKP